MEINCEHHQLLLGLIQQVPELNEDLQSFLQTEKWSLDKRHVLINLLVQKLLHSDSLSSGVFEQIRNVFPRYFIAFIHRLHTAVNSSTKIINHTSIKQRFLVLLAQIVKDYPSLHTITENHLLLTDTSLIEWNEESPKKRLKTRVHNINDNVYLLIATLRLLLLANSKIHLIHSWKWNTLSHLLEHSNDDNVKWLTYLCLSIVFNMSSDQQDLYRPNVSNTTRFNIYDMINSKSSPVSNAVSSYDNLFADNDFKKRTVFIGGIPLSKYTMNKKGNENESINTIKITYTSTIDKCLREVALSVTLGWTTLIYSSISNGKTMIVEHIADRVGKRLIKIQCSDHMDSKVLLGTYQCTDKPGEFIWTPGLLIEATSEGHWLLMEDIDAASSDVLSTIKSLIETKSIGYGSISPDFRLFLTQRDTGVPVQSNELIHLLKSVFCIVIPSYNDSEIIQIMENLPIWNNDLKLFQMKLFQLYQSLQNTKGSIHTRLVTLRDLLKCCHRLSSLSISLSVDRQLAFYDVLDCFASFLPKANRLQIIQSIGTLFNMNNQEVEFYSFKSMLEFDDLDNHYFSIGHIKLEIQKKSNQSLQQQYCFAKTRTAMFILERIARCVQMNEPVLLCGETGCGKTTLVQYLAQKTGNHLHVINLSQQSDAVDLLGGYKPFDSVLLLKQIYRDFSNDQTTNENIEQVEKSIQSKRYKEAIKLMIKCTDKDSPLRIQLIKLRESFKLKNKSALIFRFVEGSLVQALRNGDWILLDEINLASSETLQLLSGILESEQGTIWLAERGDKQPIVRHSNFRLFGCMNPASDVGKRDIPIGIRNRFTELFVDECDDRSEFMIIVEKYLHQTNIPKEYIDRIVTFYIDIQTKVKNFLLTSSSTSNNRISITYSLRTLCRALKYIATTQWSGKSYSRALFEGFCLSFFSQLDRSYYHDVQKLIHQIILQDKPSIQTLLKSTQMVVSTENSKKYIEIKNYMILKGDLTLHQNENYIFTETVTENLINIIRVLSAKSYPVLLQGETSVGKTSLINWLASATGNKCLRINNHEHTDLSEYLGTYTCSSTTGQLIFQDGPLIKAMRYGWWIILDELNLASSDILEALNRLLDDNRQLYLSETNELINAHERFQLFATQNPAGEQYAGRKRLSRAFRNRFIELHFSNLPQNELEIIIEKKCQLPKSYSKLLIQTMIDLQKYRSQKGIFSGKSSLITLRDLFRWAQRYTMYKNSCDNYKQFLAEHGYLLLAGRSRNSEDRDFIKQTIEKHFCEKKMFVNEEILFGDEGSPYSTRQIWQNIKTNNQLKHIVWTQPLRRLAILCALCLQFDEPALLVGETGCGKTTICEILSEINKQKLFTINCHTTTESADFIGSIRPVRRNEQNVKFDENQGLFEWQDGALVCSMKQGGFFLIDEISLADDSVLERLNSVLEPEKELFLAEKGYSNDDQHIDIIKAHENFRLIATMNPGGDFGKKELSPALRNRFTEIWCTPSESIHDLYSIIMHNLKLNDEHQLKECTTMMCNFIEYLRTISITKRILITVRDILSWVTFINLNSNNWEYSYEHGAYLVFIDALDSSLTLKQLIIEFLMKQQKQKSLLSETINIKSKYLSFGSYSIQRGSTNYTENEEYSFKAPTTLLNVQRLLRAMQLTNKPILIEGNPGVGKTSLVIALAKLADYSYIRINLSEQTDISDLFGSDLPDVESGLAGKFKWHDGPLLTAIKNNQWIILDELNLANQSVLEGLNACLDHRGEIYIPELNRTFYIHDKDTSIPLRIFACQNPYGQVSGRKGLPKSFLNRFTTIYFSVLEKIDLKIICQQLYEKIPDDIIDRMLNFNEKIQQEFNNSQYDFNLRDLLKWCEMFEQNNENKYKAFDLVYVKRMRTKKDQDLIRQIYQQTTEWNIEPIQIHFRIDSKTLQIGSKKWLRESIRLPTLSSTHPILLMRHQLESISSILECLSLSWPILLVGPSSRSSKSTLMHLLSCLCGHPCQTFELNSSIDTNELLGNYEQFNFQQYAKHHLNLLKQEYIKSNQINLFNDLNNESKEITIEYLNELKQYLPSNEIDKLISRCCQEQHFVWIESILIRSMRQGNWLILENVNACSLSVLDRLNSLLEPNGQLILNEGGGQGSLVKPHKDFRLILTMDPKQGNGEISRAMRNRCCEIYIDDQQQFNYYDSKELIQVCQIYQTQQQEDFIRIHQILCQKVSTFGFHNLIRSCLLFNELTHSSNEPFRLAIKTAYRTLNTRLNNEIDLLVDEFTSNTVSSNFIISPTQINDLCLQPELVLSMKQNIPLWNCSLKTDKRKFHLLFYRFIENISSSSSSSIEYDLFSYRHSQQAHLINLVKEMNSDNNNSLLLRILIEHDSIYKQLKKVIKSHSTDEELFFENSDGQFWLLMKQYFIRVLSSFDFINNDELSFSYYRSWRWFLSIIESPSNLINRRLHLIIAWPYVRSLFLNYNENSLFIQQIKQIDEQYMSIQNEFLQFYNHYQNQTHYLIKTKYEYDFLCQRYQVFYQIDLFSNNKTEKNLEKYLQYWFHYDKQLIRCFQQLNQSQENDLTILKEIETSWNELKYSSTIFDRDILFYNTFESILGYQYQWISSYLKQNSLILPFVSLSIPFNNNENPDEYFCQLISYSINPSINEIYIEKWLEQPNTKSLLYYFNIHSLNVPFGLYDKIRQQINFWSNFFWLNGSFLQCNRSNLEEFVRNCLDNPENNLKNLSLELIEQSLNRIDLIYPRGEIDPIIYEQIVNDYKLKFQSEINFEFNLRIECQQEYEYSFNTTIHQWEKQMKIIMNQLDIEQYNYYRFNNEQYQLLMNYLTKQLISNLLNKNFLIEQIYNRNEKKIYQQWRKNIVEFYKNFILSDKFYIYRDVTVPLMKQVFQIVLAFDYHFQSNNDNNQKIFNDCLFPSGLNHYNLLHIAQDLFQKRTFVQQNMATDRFRQYFILLIEYLVVYIHINHDRSKDFNQLLHSYLETVHYLWSEEERQVEEEKRLSSSIYRHETSELESEQDDYEYQRLFPSFDSDFIDFLASNEKIENEETKSVEEKPSKLSVLPYYLIFELFSSIIYNEKIALNNLVVPFFNSLYEFGEDDRLITHMIRLSIKSKETLSKYITNLNKPFDIYQDSKSSMIIESYPLVISIEKRTNQLLETHENHPTLLEILLVIQRLKSFSVESSLIKFLYGFDILFHKLTYWQETYASKSLQTTYTNELNMLTSYIIEFRKYEFNCYEQSLSMIDYNQRKLTITNWWLHLFGLINSENNLVLLEKNLHEFFQKSTLGDFLIRLELCEILSKYFNNDNLLILNSIISYYKQFQEFIQNQINAIRKPIENEIKKFFKIQQWKDTNYYSLKQSIDKSHRFLFKSIKKYKQSLLDSIQKYFPTYQIKFNYLLTKNEDFFRLINLKTILVDKNNYHIFTNYIKNDSNLINEYSSNINLMKIGTNDRKEMKQLYTEKRQLITQLFKKLTTIGLSFKKGLLNINSQASFSLSTIEMKYFDIDLNRKTYGFIKTKHKKLIIDNRLNVLEKFSSIYQETDLNYYKTIYQHNQLRLLVQINKVDPIIFQRIQGFLEHLIKIIFQQKSLLHSFTEQYQQFSKLFSIYSKRNFQYSLNNNHSIDQLYHFTISLIERIYSFLLIIRSIPSNSIEQIPIIDQKPNYIQLLNSNDFINLLEKFLERLNLLIETLNKFYDHIIDYHPMLKEIFSLHSEMCLTKQQIQNVIQKLFIDENIFPNDQFIGQLAKNFIDVYEQFSQINLIDQDKESTPSINSKPLKRYKNRLITGLNDLYSNIPTVDSSSSMWLVHYYNYFNNHINQLDLLHLTKIIPNTITSKSIVFFNEIHLLSEQILYRFIYYHHCTLQIYLSLSNTFLTLLRDGFQMPPEETEQDTNNQEQKSEGGPSGMGEGRINKDAKDVSDQIETEDQLDEAKMPGQEEQDNEKNSDEQQTVDDEKNGIEVSFDFEALMENPSNEDKEENDEEDESEGESNDDNIDDQMGSVDEDDQGEIFDEKKWGDEKNKDEEEEEDQNKPNETDKSAGKDKRQRDGLSAKDEQLDLTEESIEENLEANNNTYEDQPPEITKTDLNSEEELLELPENMDLDGNDEKEENNEENPNDLNLPEDENINLPNEESKDSNDEPNNDDENNNPKTNQITELPENLPDQEQEKLEQSALTQDKSSTADSKNQPNECQQSFANAETFEEEKEKDRKENVGESSSKQTSQTQQISSNQENQLTQELNDDLKSDNINKSSNKSNEQRTLSEIASFVDQNIKAAFDLEQTEDNNNPDDDLPSLEQNSNEKQTQIYAHAKNIPKHFPEQKQILDSATEEQTKNLNEKDDLETKQAEPMIIDNQQEGEKEQGKSSTLQKEPIRKPKSSSIHDQPSLTSETNENNEMISIEKPYISTTTVEHQFNYLSSVKPLTNNLTEQIEYQLEEWYTNINEKSNDSNEAEQLWTQLENLTQPYVFELCEQLRLLLEPTQRSKYSGDYRTGKRLNMKRIISYIASDFRKDRIWLRRSKPSKRQYQLILAIDDSQSMGNLQVKRLALESLILLGQTLNLLDVGQFGIVSFGQYITMLQPLSQNFNHQNGIQVLEQLKFDQTKTLLADLMESVTHTFNKEKLQTSNPLSQLLIILSDGRGLTVSGKDRLLKSVRHAMSQNIFVVFVILDNINHEKSSSIFQINEAVFVGDKVEFRSYLDSFPFPYYLVIQNLEMLPRALIDVLRQFLELTTTNNNSNQ
ncbi:unnamed protein product [Rotaria magnacalcarata]